MEANFHMMAAESELAKLFVYDCILGNLEEDRLECQLPLSLNQTNYNYMPLEVSFEELRDSNNTFCEKLEEGVWKSLTDDQKEEFLSQILENSKILLDELGTLKEESQFLKDELNSQREENKNLQEHIELITQENESIKKLCTELEEKYNEHSLENNVSKSIINELEAEKANLYSEKYEKEGNIDNLMERIKQSDVEYEEMRQKVTELTMQIIRSEKELESEKKIASSLTENLESNYEETEILKEKLAELESECEFFKNRHEELQFQIMAKVENSMKANSVREDSDVLMECSYEDNEDNHKILKEVEETAEFYSDEAEELGDLKEKYDREEELIGRRKSRHSLLKPYAGLSVSKNTHKNKSSIAKNKKEQGQKRSIGNSPMPTNVKLNKDIKLQKGKTFTFQEMPKCQIEKETEVLRKENEEMKMELIDLRNKIFIKSADFSLLEGELENSNDNEKKMEKEISDYKHKLFQSEQKEFEISHAFENYKKTQKDYRLELIQERERYEGEVFELTDVCNEFKEALNKCELEKEGLAKVCKKLKEEIKDSKKKMLLYEEKIKNTLSSKIEGVFERIIEQQQEEVEAYESPERTVSQKSRNNNSVKAHNSDLALLDNDFKNDDLLDKSVNVETTEWPSVLDLNLKVIKRYHKMSEEIFIDNKVLHENNDVSFLNAFDDDEARSCPSMELVEKVFDICFDMTKQKETQGTNTVVVTKNNEEVNTVRICLESKETNTERVRVLSKEVMTEKNSEEKEVNTIAQIYCEQETDTESLINYSSNETDTKELIRTVTTSMNTYNLILLQEEGINTENKESLSVETNTETSQSSVGFNTEIDKHEEYTNTDALYLTEEQLTNTTLELYNLSKCLMVYSINELLAIKKELSISSQVFQFNLSFARKLNLSLNVVDFHKTFQIFKKSKALDHEKAVFNIFETYKTQTEAKRARMHLSESFRICFESQTIDNEQKQSNTEENIENLIFPSSNRTLSNFINKQASLPFLSKPLSEKNIEKPHKTMTHILNNSSEVNSFGQQNKKKGNESSLVVEKESTYQEKEMSAACQEFIPETFRNIEANKSLNEKKCHVLLEFSELSREPTEKKSDDYACENKLLPKTKTSLYHSPIISPRPKIRNIVDFTEMLKYKKKVFKKEGEITKSSLIDSFKWDFSKFYEIEADICEKSEILKDTLILCGKGLASVLKNEYFISKLSHAKFIKDSKYYILGNSEVVIEENKIFTKKCSRSYFDGNMGEHEWRIQKISVYT